MNQTPETKPSWTSQIANDGEFRRRATTFREHITSDGSTRFPAEADRYHLYVSYACPWAHRTLITRKLKGLEHIITVDVVDHLLTSRGWTMEERSPGATRDTVNGRAELRQVYAAANADYTGAITVPVLWDKKRSTIVNNESSEIIRMFNGAFQACAKHPEVDLYPPDLRVAIDSVNAWIYPWINNGVYRSGFARTQSAYDSAVGDVFKGLERVEGILSKKRFLTGSRFTEADVRLFTTLLRFDLVYNTHFKCNLRRLADYPSAWAYTREIYAMPGVAETVDFFHIKHHYFESHRSINPFGIVPIGLEVDFDEPHGREHLGD